MDHNATFAPAGGIQELTFDEIGFVNGAQGIPGAAIGAVIGGLAGGYSYIAGQAGSSNGAGATFGGAITAIGAGIVGGAIAGGSGTWVGAVAGAAVGIAGSYVGGVLDNGKKNANVKPV